VRSTLALILLGMLAGCGGRPPIGPTPPVVDPITLTCPSDVRIENVPGASQNVTYNAPTAVGGSPPLTITCTPASGSSFPVGDTPVACSATDGIRNGVCSFRVTLVAQIPILSVTRFLAFGDSVTRGETGESAFAPLFIDVVNAYPTLLGNLLRDRYKSQTFPDVLNAGASGERAVEGTARISSVLAANPTDALLLMEGVNDLSGDLPHDADVVRDALRFDIQAAKSRGLAVFLSTLPPLDPSGFRGKQAPLIGPTNDRIRALAAEQNVVLVDSFAAFGDHGKVGDYLQADGLHPSAAGNLAIAQAFFDAIRAKFEAVQAAAARGRHLR
jgi:lysophospholipase L1-like esterase